MKFINGDRAVIHSTADHELDGITGEILGLAYESPYMSVYIVKLDSRYPKSDWDALSITEHCLTKI
jgi:hypothetical protein